jgi:hypothetical protein
VADAERIGQEFPGRRRAHSSQSNLLPERAVSADGAVAVSGRNWHASAGGFWTVVDDAIANVTIQSTPDHS